MNYFLINSNQLQLFDIEEVVESFELDRNDCIIVVRKSSKKGSKIAIRNKTDLTFFYDWKHIKFIETSKLNFGVKFLKGAFHVLDLLLYTMQVKKIIAKYGKPRTIFLGNYKNQGMRDIAYSYKNCAEIIFMDEGNTTVQSLSQRFKYLSKKRKSRKLSEIIKKNVFNLSVQHPDYPIKFFTVYNGLSNSFTKVINHSYEKNRAKYLKKIKMISETIFIASILVEFKIVTRLNYIFLLKKIKSQYGDYIYFAHPKEKDEDLLFYENEVGIKIRRLKIPIEMYFLANDHIFENLITFQSSAIINLSKIFVKKITYNVLILPEELIENDKDKSQFRELYENFKRNELLTVSEISI